MHPRVYQSNQKEPPNQNPQNPSLLLSRTISGDPSSRNLTTTTQTQFYQTYTGPKPQDQNTPRSPNPQLLKNSERFAPPNYPTSSRSVNPNYPSNAPAENPALLKSLPRPSRFEESQVNNQTLHTYQTGSGLNLAPSQIPGEPFPARTSYMSQKGPAQNPGPRLTTTQQFANTGPQPGRPSLASKLAEGQDFRTSTADELETLSREELALRLRNAETIIAELKKMLGSLRAGLGEKDEAFRLSRQVQDLTNELVGLREQNFKLKNMANDELLILEKVETKEVYGKKSKVQEELEQARKLKLEVEALAKSLQLKETVITTREREIVELRTVIDRTNNQLNTMRRVNEEIRSGTLHSQEADQLKRELETRGQLLARKDRDLSDEQAKSGSYLKSIADLNKQLEALKNGLGLKQNELDALRRELAKPAQVIIERVVPQELQQELQQLRGGQLLKEREISSLAQNLSGSTQRIKEMEGQILALQKTIKEMERNWQSGSASEKKEASELRLKIAELQKAAAERDRALLEHESRRPAFEEMRGRLAVLDAMLAERNKHIATLESEKRGTVSNEEFNTLLQKAREIEANLREKDKELSKKAELLEARDSQIREQADFIGQLKAKLESQILERQSTNSNSGQGENAELLRKRNLQLEASLQEKVRELQRLREEIHNFKIPGDTEVHDGRVPAELNKIVIEQQRAKLDAYKNMIESYQKDIENLKRELDFLRKHDGNEGAFLRSQLEIKNSEIGHLLRSLQDLKIANAELEARVKTLRDRLASLGYSSADSNMVPAPKISETLVAEFVSEENVRSDFVRNSRRRATQDLNEGEEERSLEEARAQRKRLEELRRRDLAEIRELKGTVGKLEFELEQLSNDNLELEKQLQGFREDFKNKKRDFEEMGILNRNLQSELEFVKSQTPESKNISPEFFNNLKKLLEQSFLDRTFVKKILNMLSTANFGEILRQILEQISREKASGRHPMLSEGVQTVHSQKSESTQTEFELPANQNLNLRYASPISRTNRFQSEVRDADQYQKLEEELESLRTKFNDQIAVNKKMGEKNVQLLEENNLMQNRLKETKDKKSEYKKIMVKTLKEGDERKNSRNNFDSVSRVSVDENQQGLKMLLDEIQRLKVENGDILGKYNALREQIVKRKKALLSELSNFVNTKNNFENSFFSEITRTSTTEIIVLPH